MLDNVAQALAGGGSSIEKLLQVRVYVTDIASWPEFNTIYAQWAGAARPARAVVPVPQLHYDSRSRWKRWRSLRAERHLDILTLLLRRHRQRRSVDDVLRRFRDCIAEALHRLARRGLEIESTAFRHRH